MLAAHLHLSDAVAVGRQQQGLAVRGRRVHELGAGTGVAGLAALGLGAVRREHSRFLGRVGRARARPRVCICALAVWH